MARVADKEPLRLQILKASLETLKTHGAAGFSAPLVAKTAEIRQSNITYYYPTRKSLLLATVRFALVKYEKEFQRQLSGMENFTIKKSNELLTWLFNDSIQDATVKTFPELWSLANTDRSIAVAVQQLYVDAASAVITSLGLDPKNPKCQKLHDFLLVVGSVSEGLTATHGHRKKSDPVFIRTRDAAVKLLAPELFSLYLSCSKSRVLPKRR
jgi:AcrR family transcriptional regulator